MDTELAPIIAEEVIRPPAAYRPVRSSCNEPPPYVLLQFEARPKGVWVSPQVVGSDRRSRRDWPSCRRRRLAAIDRRVAECPLPTLADDANRGLIAANAPRQVNPEGQKSDSISSKGNRRRTWRQQQQQQEAVQCRAAATGCESRGRSLIGRPTSQQRGKRYQNAAQQSLANANRGLQSEWPTRLKSASRQSPRNIEQVQRAEQVGVSRPVWVGDRLLLARRVGSGGETIVQGSWLDWPRLKSRLVGRGDGLVAEGGPCAGEW